jgi:hypothetical protein
MRREPSGPSGALGVIMDLQFGREHYWTTFFEDRKDGFGGYRLYRETDGRSEVAAEVVFWDATGSFTIETFGRDLQVEIAQALISEAQEKIPTK